ncbi:MAG: hypothetical protein M3362_00260 [Acidobacteriota bacterium]|nr:hypothetical protein [Acidobacteriota bacterium]
MAASTRDSVTETNPFTMPASNDTELDIAVAEEAEKQKRETGQSEDSASIKSRLLADGFKRDVKKPESVEDDMRLAHEDTVTARESEANATPTFDENGEPAKKSSKK